MKKNINYFQGCDYVIATVTLNPALDKIIILDQIKNCDNNKIKEEKFDIGGKGTHVSSVLSDLGLKNIATGILGGHAGSILESLLHKKDIECRFIYPPNYETRTSYIIIEKNKNNHFMLTEKGDKVDAKSVDELFELIRKLSTSCEFMIFSGGVCPGFDVNIYRKLIELANENNCKTFLDASGDYLIEGVKGKPFMIKPNIEEISDIIGHKPKNIDEIVFYAKELIKYGISIVAVTLDSNGSLIVSENETFRIYPPKIKSINTVGCGDVFFGSSIFKLYHNSNLREAFKFATAISASKAMNLMTSEFDINEALKLLDEVTVEYI
ncbi:1-phosphofructokinase family hexose kinase [Thermoanaerobacterium thermosaccharolyticum]|nr:1-phosphofructokinase family hexose kinase [Thermoanaerobacterium thermosaccharolyticum]MBE0227153.1 1-phosphofructokinase family hexose kinase [Thermoanaerobacterium thermosaccharolyticum]